jgi:hypothetical protein
MVTRAQATGRSGNRFRETSPAPSKNTPKFKMSDIESHQHVQERRRKITRRTTDPALPTKYLASLRKSDHLTPFSPLTTCLSLNTIFLSFAEHTPPPFDLIADVYIDGRTKPEVRSYVYLNPTNRHYSRSGITPKGRRLRLPGKKGEPVRRCTLDWIFTDVGIEVLLERMVVEDSTTADEGP